MDFRGDRRGQPVQIGFILLFGVLVLAFAGYQGYVVPDQNAEIEFQHFETVDDRFTELHGNAVNAVESDAERATTVPLGTRYPARLLALNPPPVAGTLRTTDPGPVTVEADGTDHTATICGDDATTRSLVYSPGYNEYDEAEGVSYENGVVAREFREATRYGEQRLVSQRPDGRDRIDLLLLNGSVDRQGVGAYAVEVTATPRRTVSVEDPTVTLPSRFGADEWRNEILDGVSGVDGVTAPEPGLVTIDFDGTYRVSCAVAGLSGPPAFGPPEAGDGPDIGPATLGNIRLDGVGAVDTGQNEAELVFRNLADGAVNVTEARIAFYQGNRRPNEAVISAAGGDDSGTLAVGGEFASLDPEITLAGGEESTVRLDFDDGVQKDDWFVLSLQFDTDEVGQYFVSLRDETDGSGDGGGSGGGAGDAPVVNQLTADDAGSNRYNVNYDVSDSDADLSRVELVLEADDGSEIDTVVAYDGGGTDRVQGNDELKETGSDEPARVRLVATDAEGNTAEATDPV